MQNDLFGKSSIEREFETFHRENPGVYRLFDHYTKQVVASGHKHYSADAIIHRIRWHTTVETQGDGFKISNNHVAYYARLWMIKNPQHDGFFRTKQRRSNR